MLLLLLLLLPLPLLQLQPQLQPQQIHYTLRTCGNSGQSKYRRRYR